MLAVETVDVHYVARDGSKPTLIDSMVLDELHPHSMVASTCVVLTVSICTLYVLTRLGASVLLRRPHAYP